MAHHPAATGADNYRKRVLMMMMMIIIIITIIIPFKGTIHPRRRNVTTLMVGLKKKTVTYAKISPKSGEPQRYSWGTQKKKKKKKKKAQFEICWQSPHCATNSLQIVHSSSLGTLVYKSLATYRALITCNMSSYVPHGMKGQLSY